MLLVSKGFTSSGALSCPVQGRPRRLWPSLGRGPGCSWVPPGGAALTRLFLCSGSHRQFKRPERSFTFQTEEPTGALSPFAPGESDQCPRQGPCRLQPGYDQPGLFQGKKLEGVSFGQNRQMGRTPSPHLSVTPQAQRTEEACKVLASLLWAGPQETDGVAGGVDMRTGKGKEKKMGHSGQISLKPLPSTWVHTHTQHTSASDAQTRGDAKAPTWVLAPVLHGEA